MASVEAGIKVFVFVAAGWSRAFGSPSLSWTLTVGREKFQRVEVAAM